MYRSLQTSVLLLSLTAPAAAGVNSPPTDIMLSNALVEENAPVGTLVGTLSTTDPDPGDWHSYALLSSDAWAFQIVGNELRTAAVLDYETQTHLTPQIRSTDLGGLWYERFFTIIVVDVPEPVPFCAGDGSQGACPCGNDSALWAGEGCRNSTGVGAYLLASGTPSVANDSLQLTVANGEPNQVCILVSNISATAGQPLFDGRLCLPFDAKLTRHYRDPGTGAPAPILLDGSGTGTNGLPLSQTDFNGNTAPGVTVYYQAWMRSPAGPCAHQSNLSSGLAVTWTP